MKKADIITGFILLVLAGYVIREAWTMPQSGTFGPGPGFLPLWLGALLAFLAVILLVTSWSRRPTEKDRQSPFPGVKPLLSVASVLLGLALYTLLMETLGFLVDTFLFVAYLMLVVERERWPTAILVAASTTAALYLVFQVLLTITLPRNMFGF